MTKHTSTPWRGEMHGVLQDWPSIVDGKGALIVRTYGPNANADMRRIVACVNECAGTPTEELGTGALLAEIKRLIGLGQLYLTNERAACQAVLAKLGEG